MKFLITKKKIKQKPKHTTENRGMSGQGCMGEAKSVCGKEGGWTREGSSLLLTEGLSGTLVAFQGAMNLVPGWLCEKITVGNSFHLS